MVYFLCIKLLLLIIIEDIRDFFEPGGNDRICSILKHYNNDNIIQYKDVIFNSISIAKTVSKSENNKGY